MSQLPTLSDPAYRIEAELGAGGGSVVYKAWHSRLQKHVVLKRIKDESGLIQSGLQRGEVDILKHLKHTYLPQLYDFLDDPSGVYTVIEFIPGLSFADLLKQPGAGTAVQKPQAADQQTHMEGRRFAQKDVLRWAEQLSGALAYLHGQKPTVLHSDIKPANIMLTPDGDVCLIDFNISLVLDGDGAGALGLSHGYASPEQYGSPGMPRSKQAWPTGVAAPMPTELDGRLSGGPGDPYATELSTGNTTDLRFDNVGSPPAHAQQPSEGRQLASPEQRGEHMRMDARSDIYSLGATLYHLLTGVRPETATGNIRPISGYSDISLSEAFIYIIERCMERDPAKRFQTSADLHDAIVNIRRLDKRWKRQRARTVAAVAVLSALLVAFGAMAAYGQMLMGSEKLEKYNNYVLSIPGDVGDSAFEAAIQIFPEKPDAYREQAAKLYISGMYEECIEYVKNAMAKLSAYPHDEQALRMIGDIYHAQGNAYFELEQYSNSLPAFEAALGNKPGDPEIYRDFAIALARSGYVDRAEELLADAAKAQLGSDSIDLLKGEIAYAKGDDRQAIPLFEAVISGTDNPHIRNRAYMICIMAYRRAPELVSSEIKLLRNALIEMPDNYTLIVKERLADALVRTEQYAEAAELYSELRRSGNLSYYTWQNIGVLYQQMGDLSGARAVYLELADAYPDDYRPPMRLAFLTLQEQSELPNEERDYGEVAQWHSSAQGRYDKRPASASDDMEMLLLNGLIEELKQNGWIR